MLVLKKAHSKLYCLKFEVKQQFSYSLLIWNIDWITAPGRDREPEKNSGSSHWWSELSRPQQGRAGGRHPHLNCVDASLPELWLCHCLNFVNVSINFVDVRARTIRQCLSLKFAYVCHWSLLMIVIELCQGICLKFAYVCLWILLMFVFELFQCMSLKFAYVSLWTLLVFVLKLYRCVSL